MKQGSGFFLPSKYPSQYSQYNGTKGDVRRQINKYLVPQEYFIMYDNFPQLFTFHNSEIGRFF